MDVWCSSCWEQFRVGAEYPWSFLPSKKSRAHDSEAKKTKGRYVITQNHHKIRFATAHMYLASSMSNFCSSLLHTCHVGSCLVLARQTWASQKLTSATHSLINFPAIVSHDYSAISMALNNILCPKKLSIQRVYVAVACFDSRQQ